jgi:hypothetical protein
VLLACGTSYGWARVAHATVAKIAENHLSPKAKKMLDKYLDGKSITYYASYADDYKPEMLMDLGFEPSNAKRKVTFPHSFSVDDNYNILRGQRDGDKFVKNCVYLADEYAADLKANHRDMDDSLRMLKIAMIVHWLGDMHCPKHIRVPEEQTLGYYQVKWGSRSVRYHDVWDGIFFDPLHPWGFNECAELLDDCDKNEIKAITKGNVYDWGADIAKRARCVNEFKEGDVIDTHAFRNKYRNLVETAVRDAGYRLAAMFNTIFK